MDDTISDLQKKLEEQEKQIAELEETRSILEAIWRNLLTLLQTTEPNAQSNKA